MKKRKAFSIKKIRSPLALVRSRRFMSTTVVAVIAGILIIRVLPVGASPFVTDTFTDSPGTALEAHTSDGGATWIKSATAPSSSLSIDSANRLRSNVAATSAYYSSATPSTNEYDVEADIVDISTPGTRQVIGIFGRGGSATNSGYDAWYDTADAKWHLFVFNTDGSTADLGSFAQALSPGTTYHMVLQIRNATKKVFIDGVQRISTTSNTLSQSGVAGVVTAFTVTSGTGLAIDNFSTTNQGVPATAYTLTGPSTGIVGKSVTYTVSPNGGYIGTITPATTGTGTFSPTSLTFNGDNSPQTFTYTPTSFIDSPHTISTTSAPAISNPASINMVVKTQSSQFVSDNFTDTIGTNLSAHVGAVGAVWTHSSNGAGDVFIDSANRVRGNVAAASTYLASGAPTSADYLVQANITQVSTAADYIGLGGRVDTSAGTMYLFEYSNTRGQWELYKVVGGSLGVLATSLGSFGTVGTTHTLALSMIGSSIQAYVDGVLKLDATDSAIPAAGSAAVVAFGAATDSTGQHMDNFAAYDLVGPATGFALAGPSFGSVNTASSTFKVTPNGTYTGTVTPATTGTGTFSPASLTFSNESAPKTFTYTPTSLVGSPHTISISSSPALTNPSPLTYAVTNGATNFTVSNPNWFWSPYDTYLSGSSSATMLTPGAYSKLKFTGTSAVLSVDVSALTGASIVADRYPKLAYAIDGGARSTVQLTSSTTSLLLAAGLSSGTHTLYLQMIADSVFNDHWNTPVSPIKITGLTLDTGATLITPTLLPKRAVFFGASETSAYDVNSGDNTVDANDAAAGFVTYLGAFFNAEYAQIGYGGQGWIHAAADGTTPGLPSTWNNYYAGHPRLSGGLFTPLPDYVFVSEGHNDGGVFATSIVTNWITDARAAAGSAAKIFVLVPISGVGRANLTTGYNDYKTAHPSDAKVYLLDLGSLSYPSTDGLHPTAVGHQIIANAIEAAIYATATPNMGTATASITKGSTGNTVQLVGMNTYWRAGMPALTLSGGSGASITQQTVIDSTHATLTISAGSTLGTLTVTDSESSASTTIQVVAAPATPPISSGSTKESTLRTTANTETINSAEDSSDQDQSVISSGKEPLTANADSNPADSRSKRASSSHVNPIILWGVGLGALTILGVSLTYFFIRKSSR